MAFLQENLRVQFPLKTSVWLHNLMSEQKDQTSKGGGWGGGTGVAKQCRSLHSCLQRSGWGAV